MGEIHSEGISTKMYIAGDCSLTCSSSDPSGQRLVKMISIGIRRHSRDLSTRDLCFDILCETRDDIRHDSRPEKPRLVPSICGIRESRLAALSH